MSTDSLPDPEPRPRRLVGERSLKPLKVRLKTTTPLLGGSSVPRQLDALDPLRVPSIRGHLRFWWRALHGHTYDTPAELARAERELWGGVGKDTGTRSRVEVRVQLASAPGKEDQDSSDISQRSPEAYALWVARAQETEGQEKSAALRWRPDLRFELQVLVPEDRAPEVERAIRAWVLWGGYGSRTRRGLGSLTVVEEASTWLPSRPSREEWSRLFPGVPLFGPVDAGKSREFPLLRGARLLVGAPVRDASSAWKTALMWVRDFRQKEGKPDTLPSPFAREFKPGRPGRSFWPESDGVRRLFPPKKESWAHDPRPQSMGKVFWPRAGFGLPLAIRFQRSARPPAGMKHGPKYEKGEPPDVELHWEDAKGVFHERLASPLIVKAMPLANGSFVPIALWLRRVWPQGHVILVHKEKGKKVRIQDSEAPFDPLPAPNDTALYAPLLQPTLEEAFFSWVKDFHDVKEFT